MMEHIELLDLLDHFGNLQLKDFLKIGRAILLKKQSHELYRET